MLTSSLNKPAGHIRATVSSTIFRKIPKLNYTSSLSASKHPYPQEGKLNASEKITRARTHTRIHPYMCLVTRECPHTHRDRCVFSVSSFLLAGGWTFRATKKDTLSPAGSPQEHAGISTSPIDRICMFFYRYCFSCNCRSDDCCPNSSNSCLC